MLQYGWTYRKLKFKFAAKTSRDTLHVKDCYYLKAFDHSHNRWNFGECSFIAGLSIDDTQNYTRTLDLLVNNLNLQKEHTIELHKFPSIKAGLETLQKNIQMSEMGKIFDNDFYNNSAPIKINGLLWMGDHDFIVEQIKAKIENQYSCIKMKIGALDWSKEFGILKMMRNLGGSDLIIRVDANGAWNEYDIAMQRLEDLNKIGVHSIEQPIKTKNWEVMQNICHDSPIPIAFDEELIGIFNREEKEELLEELKPQYLVLKPSLHGAFSGCDEWIKLARSKDIGYWITSALESNIGLNAIAQYTYEKNIDIHHGLGTGQLYFNNIDSPLTLEKDSLFYDSSKEWEIDELL